MGYFLGKNEMVRLQFSILSMFIKCSLHKVAFQLLNTRFNVLYHISGYFENFCDKSILGKICKVSQFLIICGLNFYCNFCVSINCFVSGVFISFFLLILALYMAGIRNQPSNRT